MKQSKSRESFLENRRLILRRPMWSARVGQVHRLVLQFDILDPA